MYQGLKTTCLEIFRHALIEIGDKDRSEIIICLRLPQINQGLPAHARRRDNERNGWKTGRKTEPLHAPPSSTSPN